MSFNNITAENQQGVLIVTINRADKLNALNIATLQEIKTAVEQVQNDASVLGIVITGAGPKAFAAGADISEFANFNTEQGREMSANGHAVMNTIENSAKVTVAAVNGFALGGGCELAMACHLRIASPNAKFGQPEVNLGVPPGYAGTQRLVQLVGKGRALEMLLAADPIDAQKALDFGLVNRVVEQENLLAESIALVQKIGSKSPSAVKKVIACVNEYFKGSAPGMQKEIDEFGHAFGTEDYKEGTTAFLEKRKANFTGR